MKPQQEDLLREMQLAHIGKLMAGLSHEFKNHLAIIKESSGLIEDLLLLDESRQPVQGQRYKKIIGAINERITQAAEMCRFLSSFSHRMDEPLSSFSVSDVLQEEMYLLRRFAHHKQTNLSFSGQEGLPLIYNNPSLLQFAVFCIVWPALDFLQNGRITVTAVKHETGAEIVVHRNGKISGTGDSPWRTAFPAALQMLGGEISRKTRQEDDEETGIVISSLAESRPGT